MPQGPQESPILWSTLIPQKTLQMLSVVVRRLDLYIQQAVRPSLRDDCSWISRADNKHGRGSDKILASIRSDLATLAEQGNASRRRCEGFVGAHLRSVDRSALLMREDLSLLGPSVVEEMEKSQLSGAVVLINPDTRALSHSPGFHALRPWLMRRRNLRQHRSWEVGCHRRMLRTSPWQKVVIVVLRSVVP